jgi:hypothetical protein
MQQLPPEPEVFRLQEGGTLGRPMATCPFEAGLDDEHVFGEGKEVPFLVEGFPIFHKGESTRNGVGIFREETLLDDFALVEEERAKPRGEKEHRAAKEVDA